MAGLGKRWRTGRRDTERNPLPVTSVVAVDIGLTGIGFARWNMVAPGSAASLVAPDMAGVIELPRAREGDPWDVRATAIFTEYVVGPWAGSNGGFGGPPKVQVIEWPEYRGGDAVGIAAAGEESLGKLYFMAGMHKRLADTVGTRTVLAPVREWKGQLPKRVVAKRIARAVGTEDGRGVAFDSHAWDAVGVGLWFLGHRLDDAKKFGGAK